MRQSAVPGRKHQNIFGRTRAGIVGWAGALVQWLWEMTQDLEVVGSNPGTVYWMEMTFFALICSKHCIDVRLKRPKINEKEAGVGPLKKNPFGPISK